MSMLTLIRLECFAYPAHIKPKTPTQVLADLVEFVNDRIGAFHLGDLGGSCSGVHITGGSKPWRRQMASIVPRIAALAMCLQFHVSKYLIPCAAEMAMWNASTAARVGSPPPRINASAISIASSETLSSGIPSSAVSLRSDALGSPTAASLSTRLDTNRENLLRRRHQSCVTRWRAAWTTSREARDVRNETMLVST